MASRSLKRLEEIIFRKVATVVQRDLADPRLGFVTITHVKLARDFESCRVWWSCLEEGGARTATAAALEAARPFIQREVAGTLRLRKAPVLFLEFDEAIEGIDRMTRLIRDARAEDAEREAARGETPAPETEAPADEERAPEAP